MISRQLADIQPALCCSWKLSPRTGPSHSTCQVLSDGSQCSQQAALRNRNKEQCQVTHRKLCFLWSKMICTALQQLEETFDVSLFPGQLQRQLNILSSTNPSTLPWMVWKSWMHCPVWHRTRVPGFIFSDLVFAGKDKNHNLSAPTDTGTAGDFNRASTMSHMQWASPAEPGHTAKHAVWRAVKTLASPSLSCL